MKHHLSIDLETFSSVPIGKSGAYKYVQSPDFEILLFAYSVDDGPVEIVDLAQGEILPDWLYKAVESPEYIKHAYNAAFEWYCLSKFYGHLLPVDQWRDTMLHGLYCGYTAGLDATGKALGLPAEKQKLSVGKALIRYFCVPCTPTQSNGGRHRNLPKHDPDKWDLFKTYCLGDVTTEKEIERRLSAFPVPDDIEKQWQTDLLINARGVAVDMGMVRGALEIGAQSRDRLMQEAISITGLENPNSIAQLSTWLEKATDTPVTDLRKDTVAATFSIIVSVPLLYFFVPVQGRPQEVAIHAGRGLNIAVMICVAVSAAVAASAVCADVNALNALAQTPLVAVLRLFNSKHRPVHAAGMGDSQIFRAGRKDDAVLGCNLKELLREFTLLLRRERLNIQRPQIY